jgi:DNA-binding NarL/FixJ family response regulator
MDEALESGADGYLVKGTAGEELVAAVKEAVAARKANTAEASSSPDSPAARAPGGAR